MGALRDCRMACTRLQINPAAWMPAHAVTASTHPNYGTTRWLSTISMICKLRAKPETTWRNTDKQYLYTQMGKADLMACYGQPSPAVHLVTGPGPYALLTTVALMGAAMRDVGTVTDDHMCR